MPNRIENIGYNDILNSIIKDKGGTPEDYRRLLDQIAYHESAKTMDPAIYQRGGGPGRGKYQFEGPDGSNRLLTSAQRTANYLKKLGKPVPRDIQRILSGDIYDATQLHPELQDMLVLGDLRMKGGLDLKDFTSGKLSIEDLWVDHWWAGDKSQRPAQREKFVQDMKHFEQNFQPTQQEQPLPTSIKDSVPNLANFNFKFGGHLNQFPDGGGLQQEPYREPKEFLKSYINSPKYKERFQATSDSRAYDGYLNHMNQNLNTSKTRYLNENDSEEVRRLGSHYDPRTNTTLMEPNNPNNEKVASHEYSHNALRNLRLPSNNEELLKKVLNQSGLKSKHDLDPKEAKADIDALRYILNKNKIYDARTEDFSQEHLEKARQELKGNFIFERLLKKANNDDNLIEWMNKIADTEQLNNVNIAAYGGKLNNTENQEKQKQPWSREQKKPIYVDSKNDPRYVAYQDSLKSWEGGSKVLLEDPHMKINAKQRIENDRFFHPDASPNLEKYREHLLPGSNTFSFFKPSQEVLLKKKPITVTDPNDPRLKAYKDSLNLHNDSQRFLKVFNDKIEPLLKEGKNREAYDYWKEEMKDTSLIEESYNNLKKLNNEVPRAKEIESKYNKEFGVNLFSKPKQEVILQNREPNLNTDLVAYLQSQNKPHSYAERKRMYEEITGKKDYKGTPEQNIGLLQTIKGGGQPQQQIDEQSSSEEIQQPQTPIPNRHFQYSYYDDSGKMVRRDFKNNEKGRKEFETAKKRPGFNITNPDNLTKQSGYAPSEDRFNYNPNQFSDGGGLNRRQTDERYQAGQVQDNTRVNQRQAVTVQQDQAQREHLRQQLLAEQERRRTDIKPVTNIKQNKQSIEDAQRAKSEDLRITDLPLLYFNDPMKILGDIGSALNPNGRMGLPTTEQDRIRINSNRFNSSLPSNERMKNQINHGLELAPEAALNVAASAAMLPARALNVGNIVGNTLNPLHGNRIFNSSKGAFPTINRTPPKNSRIEQAIAESDGEVKRIIVDRPPKKEGISNEKVTTQVRGMFASEPQITKKDFFKNSELKKIIEKRKLRDELWEKLAETNPTANIKDLNNLYPKLKLNKIKSFRDKLLTPDQEHFIRQEMDWLEHGLDARNVTSKQHIYDYKKGIEKSSLGEQEKKLLKSFNIDTNNPFFQGYIKEKSIPNLQDFSKIDKPSFFRNFNPGGMNKYGGRIKSNQFTLGGNLINTNKMNNINMFNEGGSHEQNPLGGIPQGMGDNGQMNTVEEGEGRMGDMIYSDRIPLPEEAVLAVGLPRKFAGKTPAQALAEIDKIFKDRNDRAAQETKADFAEKIAQAQELVKAQQEEIDQSMAANAGEVPDMMGGDIPQGMEEFMQPEQMMGAPTGEPLLDDGRLQTGMQEQPQMFMRGGKLNRYRQNKMFFGGNIGGNIEPEKQGFFIGQQGQNNMSMLGAMGTGVGYGMSANQNVIAGDAKDNQMIDSTKDTVAQAIGPIGQMFRGIQKAGQGIGNTVGGEVGAGIADAFSPEESTIAMWKDKDANVWEKIGGTVPILGGVIAHRAKEKKQAQEDRKNLLMQYSQQNSDFAYGGKINKYQYGGDKNKSYYPEIDSPTQSSRMDDMIHFPSEKMGNLKPTIFNKAGDWMGDNKDGIRNTRNAALRLAPIAMNLARVGKAGKYDKVSPIANTQRFQPRYADEMRMQNLASSEMNNQIRGIGQSGASQGAMRSSILGAGLNRAKTLGSSMAQAEAQNAQMDMAGQQFNNAVTEANIARQIGAEDRTAMNKGQALTNKNRLLDQIGTDIGNIGKEETFKKIAEITGYNFLGKFLNANPNATKEDAIIAAKKFLAENETTEGTNAYGGKLKLKRY
jgi:hypothetical protein